MWSNEFSGCATVEIRDKKSKVFRKAHVFKGVDQLFVVRGGEGPFEVKVAHDYVFLTGVGVLHTEVEVFDRSGTRPVRPKAFLFWA